MVLQTDCIALSLPSNSLQFLTQRSCYALIFSPKRQYSYKHAICRTFLPSHTSPAIYFFLPLNFFDSAIPMLVNRQLHIATLSSYLPLFSSFWGGPSLLPSDCKTISMYHCHSSRITHILIPSKRSSSSSSMKSSNSGYSFRRSWIVATFRG